MRHEAAQGDEGRPLGAGLQELASNHLKLLWSNARVVRVYVTSLGPNQTIGMRGSRCILVIFGDKDLRGVVEAHILFQNDGIITHTYKNEKSWAECQ